MSIDALTLIGQFRSARDRRRYATPMLASGRRQRGWRNLPRSHNRSRLVELWRIRDITAMSLPRCYVRAMQRCSRIRTKAAHCRLTDSPCLTAASGRARLAHEANQSCMGACGRLRCEAFCFVRESRGGGCRVWPADRCVLQQCIKANPPALCKSWGVEGRAWR